MADNTPQNGSATIAADDVGGVLVQRMKPVHGTDGVATDTSSTNPLPVYRPDVSAFPATFLRVTDEPRQVFYDPFDGGTVDVTNRWTSTNSGGGVAAAQATGNLTLGTGTTISGYSHLVSQPSFVLPIPGWLGVSAAIKNEWPVTANTYRFWGQGTAPGSPTAAAPLTDAVGFELATDGKLYAVVYAGGTRTVIQDLSAATGNSKQPTDANFHRYIVYVRTDIAYWYIDGLGSTQLVATSSFQGPQVQSLPVRLQAVAGSSAPGSSGVLTCAGFAVWDTAKNTTQLGDGTYPWRRASISATGRLATDLAEQADASATGTMSALNATVASTVPSGASSWTVRLGGTFQAASVVSFEGSIDGGTTWDAVPMAGRFSINVAPATSVTGTLVTSFNFNTWTGAAINLTNVRVKLSTFTAGDGVTATIKVGTAHGVILPSQYFVSQGLVAAGGAIGSSGNPLYVAGQDSANVRALDLRLKGTQSTYGLGTQDLKDAGRTHVMFSATNAAAGTTTTETAISLTKSSGTSATSAANSFVVTSAKRFRITSVTFATRGHATATIQTTTFNLRINTAGAVATTSTPILLSARSATPATASAWDRLTVPLPDGIEILGDGTLQFGVTAAATYTTNAPTWDVLITGFEY